MLNFLFTVLINIVFITLQLKSLCNLKIHLMSMCQPLWNSEQHSIDFNILITVIFSG